MKSKVIEAVATPAFFFFLRCQHVTAQPSASAAGRARSCAYWQGLSALRVENWAGGCVTSRGSALPSAAAPAAVRVALRGRGADRAPAARAQRPNRPNGRNRPGARRGPARS